MELELLADQQHPHWRSNSSCSVAADSQWKSIDEQKYIPFSRFRLPFLSCPSGWAYCPAMVLVAHHLSLATMFVLLFAPSLRPRVPMEVASHCAFQESPLDEVDLVGFGPLVDRAGIDLLLCLVVLEEH